MIVSPFFSTSRLISYPAVCVWWGIYPGQGRSYYQRLSSWGRPALVGAVVIAELKVSEVEVEIEFLRDFVFLRRAYLLVLVVLFVIVFGVRVVECGSPKRLKSMRTLPCVVVEALEERVVHNRHNRVAVVGRLFGRESGGQERFVSVEGVVRLVLLRGRGRGAVGGLAFGPPRCGCCLGGGGGGERGRGSGAVEVIRRDVRAF